MTVAVDVILEDIDESLRFSTECRARVLHKMESFCHSERIPVIEKFFLDLFVCLNFHVSQMVSVFGWLKV